MNKSQSRFMQNATRHPKASAASKQAKAGRRGVSMSARGGESLELGVVATGKVEKLLDCGAIVSLDAVAGMIHISEISDKWVSHPSEVLAVGQVVRAVVISIDVGKNQVGLSIKKMP